MPKDLHRLAINLIYTELEQQLEREECKRESGNILATISVVYDLAHSLDVEPQRLDVV